MQTSIAAALFDIPTVWGWAAPGKPMPDTWRVIFDEKHVDGKVYSKVFSSCRTGREWVLRNAPSAQLHLNTVSPMHPRAWFGRLTRAAAALDTRGGLTTRMKVTCDDSAESAAACGLMPSVLAGHTAGVTHLVVSDVSAQRPCEFSVALLRVVLLPFPNLTSLTLSPCPPTIPSRDHLKGLKQLSLSADVLTDSILTSCAPLLQQLTSLTLRGGEAAQRPQWPLLFNAASTTSTLTSFTTDHSLTDTLMDLLMQHAPALGQLTVHALRMGVDYSARHWSVRELRAGMGRPHCILWFQLMALPSGKRSLISDGRLALYVEGAEVCVTHTHTHTHTHTQPACTHVTVVCGFCQHAMLPACMCWLAHSNDSALLPTIALFVYRHCKSQHLLCLVMYAQGLSAASIERLTEWTFVLKEVSVLHGNLPTADHPAALRAALGQLHDGLRVVKRGHDSSRGPGEGQGGSGAGVVAADNQCTVRLCDWPWTPELLRTVAPYYVAYAEKQLKLRLTEIPTLTDELLSAAIEVAPLMPVLRAEKIALQSDQHAAAAWPWDTLGIEVADALQLLMLPAPSGPGALRSLVLQQLTIPSVIPQVRYTTAHSWSSLCLCTGFRTYIQSLAFVVRLCSRLSFQCTRSVQRT